MGNYWYFWPTYSNFIGKEEISGDFVENVVENVGNVRKCRDCCRNGFESALGFVFVEIAVENG